MAKNVYIILGNGFTIDLLNHLNKREVIDVTNLFSQGPFVPWPANGQPGFLSSKHCPNLWNLGARAHIETFEGLALIENIITCASVYIQRNFDPKNPEEKRKQDIYILAYQELVKYLKHLFVFYNEKINITTSEICEWSWYKFFNKLYTDENIKNVYITTYNYDIFLERVLKTLNIGFHVEGFGENPNHKFVLMKPHGSISFCHEQVFPKETIETSRDGDLFDKMRLANLEKFSINYEDLSQNFAIDALIPPTSEADRLNPPWVQRIRQSVQENAKKLSSDDCALISGISYWHVDRKEIDDILISLNTKMDVKMLNPNPPKALDAVLTSVFENYISYPSSNILNEVNI